MVNDQNQQEIYYQNAVSLVGEDDVVQSYVYMAGSTDMGDVSQIMPAYTHTQAAQSASAMDDFLINDFELAIIVPAKVLAMTVIDLLADDAAKAKEIKAKCKPILTKEEYILTMDSLLTEEEYFQ